MVHGTGFLLTWLYIPPVFCISFLHKSYKHVTGSWFLKRWIRGKNLVYMRDEKRNGNAKARGGKLL
jgi:hypothetical protein